MQVRSIHYELTDLCNAGCPQCIRTNPVGCKPKEWLLEESIDLATFRRHSPPTLLRGLDSAFFCGNFGDPAVVPELIGILTYCWEVNAALKLKLHTNASLRSVDWWTQLAEAAAGRRFRVVAGIDGASHESNRRYRVGTDFSRIMANLSAFIAAGGEAEWRMIVFRHNEHEVDTAARLAADMGFVAFRSYPSDRFGSLEASSYVYRGERFRLEPPLGSHAPKHSGPRRIPEQELDRSEVVIDCQALAEGSAFVDFQGYLLPCCHIGRKLYQWNRGHLAAGDSSIAEVFESFDTERLNVDTAGQAAAHTAYDAFLTHLARQWANQGPQVCKVVCGRRTGCSGTIPSSFARI